MTKTRIIRVDEDFYQYCKRVEKNIKGQTDRHFGTPAITKAIELRLSHPAEPITLFIKKRKVVNVEWPTWQ